MPFVISSSQLAPLRIPFATSVHQNRGPKPSLRLPVLVNKIGSIRCKSLSPPGPDEHEIGHNYTEPHLFLHYLEESVVESDIESLALNSKTKEHVRNPGPSSVGPDEIRAKRVPRADSLTLSNNRSSEHDSSDGQIITSEEKEHRWLGGAVPGMKADAHEEVLTDVWNSLLTHKVPSYNEVDGRLEKQIETRGLRSGRKVYMCRDFNWGKYLNDQELFEERSSQESSLVGEEKQDPDNEDKDTAEEDQKWDEKFRESCYDPQSLLETEVSSSSDAPQGKEFWHYEVNRQNMIASKNLSSSEEEPVAEDWDSLKRAWSSSVDTHDFGFQTHRESSKVRFGRKLFNFGELTGSKYLKEEEAIESLSAFNKQLLVDKHIVKPVKRRRKRGVPVVKAKVDRFKVLMRMVDPANDQDIMDFGRNKQSHRVLKRGSSSNHRLVGVSSDSLKIDGGSSGHDEYNLDSQLQRGRLGVWSEHNGASSREATGEGGGKSLPKRHLRGDVEGNVVNVIKTERKENEEEVLEESISYHDVKKVEAFYAPLQSHEVLEWDVDREDYKVADYVPRVTDRLVLEDNPVSRSVLGILKRNNHTSGALAGFADGEPPCRQMDAPSRREVYTELDEGQDLSEEGYEARTTNLESATMQSNYVQNMQRLLSDEEEFIHSELDQEDVQDWERPTNLDDSCIMDAKGGSSVDDTVSEWSASSDDEEEGLLNQREPQFSGDGHREVDNSGDLLHEFLNSRTGNRDTAREGRVYKWNKQPSKELPSRQEQLYTKDERPVLNDSGLHAPKSLTHGSQFLYPIPRPKGKGMSFSLAKAETHMEPAEHISFGENLPRGHEHKNAVIHSGKNSSLSTNMNEILRIASNLPDNRMLEEFMDPCTNKVSNMEGNLILEALGEENSIYQVLSFFQWMRLQEPCLLDPRSFSILFVLLGRAGMADKAVDYYRIMPPETAFHCVQVYNSLITSLTDCDRHGEISSLLEQMQNWGTAPDSVTFSILMTSARKGEHSLKDVWSLYQGMLQRGVRPGVTVFGELIKTFCDAGNLRAALIITTEMERLEIPLNIVIYNILIDGYGKLAQLEEAEGLVCEMRAKGIEPNVTTYNVLIHGYGRIGQFDVAEGLVQEMEAIGLRPDVVTYTSLISAYGHANLSEKAAGVFNRMQTLGITPNAHSYTALIHAYAEGRWHVKAAKAFELMRKEGISPTVETFTALLEVYRKVGNIGMVKEVWKAMKAEACVGTRVTFVTLMDAFAKQGRFQAARDVIHEFANWGYKPDLMVYNMLVNAYARGGRHEKTPEVLKEMKEKGLEPDSFTYCTLIYAFLRVRDFSRAYKYHNEMLKKGKRPDPKTYAKLRAILRVAEQRKIENNRKANLGQQRRSAAGKRGTEKAKSFWKGTKRPSRRALKFSDGDKRLSHHAKQKETTLKRLLLQRLAPEFKLSDKDDSLRYVLDTFLVLELAHLKNSLPITTATLS